MELSRKTFIDQFTVSNREFEFNSLSHSRGHPFRRRWFVVAVGGLHV